EIRQRPHEGVVAVGREAGDGSIEVARKGAHLILQRGESADVKDLALFVKRGHWFSADARRGRPPPSPWRLSLQLLQLSKPFHARSEERRVGKQFLRARELLGLQPG